MEDPHRPPSRLAQLRIAAGLTQEELAERAGLSPRGIGKLEAGRVARPRVHTLEQIGRSLGLTGDALTGFVAEHRARPPRDPVRVTAADPVPRELPPRPPVLVGRDHELDRLAAHLRPGGGRGPAVVSGLGGMGKSAFATEAAARAAESFPDGQHFAVMTAPDGSGRAAVDVLADLLVTAGVPARDLPDGESARAGAWRSRLAGRRVLVLLDDAVDEAQVRPLLVDGDCRVLVTSRRPLAGLDLGLAVRLGPLDDDAAAAALLAVAARAGVEVTAGELGASIAACGGIPLALRLLAGRLALLPRVGADDGLAASVLDELVGGDRSVRAGIDRSLDLLGPAATRLVEVLVGLDLPWFPPWVVLAAGDDPGRSALAELVGLGVLDPVGPSRDPERYAVHDLVRARIRERGVDAGDADVERVAAWAIHLTAAAAGELARPVAHVLWPARPETLDERRAAAVVGDLARWSADAVPVVTALTRTAAARALPVTAGALLATVRMWLTRAGRFADLADLARRSEAVPGADELVRACARLVRTGIDAELGNWAAAAAELEAILPALAAADVCTVANAWYDLGWCHQHLGRSGDAEQAYGRALGLHASIGNRYGELGCWLGLAELRADTDPAGAALAAGSALDTLAGFTDYRLVAKARIAVSRALPSWQPGTVADLLQASRDQALDHGDDVLAATCLAAVARARRRAGDHVAARAAAERAVAELVELDHPAALAGARAELALLS